MDGYAKGLAIIAAASFLAACGGSSAPPPATALPAPPPEPAPAPGADPADKAVVVLAAEPQVVPAGQSTELVWSSPGAERCEALGAWSGARDPAGRETSIAIVEPREFRIRCTGPGGTAEQTARVIPAPPLRVVDKFGRTIGGDRPLVLVDWEGQMANPAIEFQLIPSGDLPLPLNVEVAGSDPRLFFDYPHLLTRPAVIQDPSGIRVRVESFSDYDSTSEYHELSFSYLDAAGVRRTVTAPVLEIDQDRARPLDYPVHVDFSEDTIGFFDSEKKRALIRMAAENWAYFFDDHHLDPVAANSEATQLWHSHPDGYVDVYRVENREPYDGFLLYAQGFTSSLSRSGGSASTFGGFQHSAGAELPLRRSGSVQIEVEGSYHTPGWFLSDSADDWYHRWWNLMDLLHIAQHETGHALIFSPAFPKAAEFQAAGRIVDQRVHDYLGEYPRINADFHLVDQLDPESLKGAFGNHLNGPMLVRRWVPTKLDLLVAQAIGYELRQTSAFVPLSIETAALPDAHADAPYAASLEPAGGIPFYDWQVTAGALPPGLELDRFDGILFGVPSEPGEYTFTLSVTDYPPRRDTASKTFTLTVS